MTVGKALVTAVLGLAALVALASTVCGMVLSMGSPQGGFSVVLISALVLIGLIYAIVWLWR